MSADQDLVNSSNGVDGNGQALPWRWVRARARTVFGNLNKLQPFNWPNRQQAATTSEYDAITATAEQVGWRYVDSAGNVVCPKDILLVWWEHFLKTTDPKDVAAAIDKAKVLRSWPAGFAGAPDYEK